MRVGCYTGCDYEPFCILLLDNTLYIYCINPKLSNKVSIETLKCTLRACILLVQGGMLSRPQTNRPAMSGILFLLN